MEEKNIKIDILSVTTFIENRPDMSSYNNGEIQSAINQTATFLNARTNGLIGRVWYVEDETNTLFRTPEEKEFIVEAFIVQTQYTLNLGNDFTQGSESLSTGSFSASFQRPIERKEIAPGVDVLLQAARVFQFQDFSLINNSCDTNNNREDLENYLTVNQGDIRYVAKNQPNALKGSVAVVGDDNIVNFQNPNTVAWNTLNAQRILDPSTGEYTPINQVEKLAFFGPNLYGYGSAVERGEIFNYLILVNKIWQPYIEYKKDQLCQDVGIIEGEEVLINFLALRDNVNKKPIDNPEDWKQLGTIQIDIVTLQEFVYNNVVAKYDVEFADFKNSINLQFTNFTADINAQFSDFSGRVDDQFFNLADEIRNNFVPTEINKQLTELPTLDFSPAVFSKGVLYDFGTLNLFTEIKNQYNILDTDYEVDNFTTFTGFGLNGAIVGNGIINENNIVGKDWSIYSLFNANINSNDRRTVFGNKNISTFSSKLSNYYWYVGVDSRTFQDINIYNLSWSFGSSNPIEFKPKYREVYRVRFLKDIKVNLKGIINPSSIELQWGSLKGDIENQKDLITKFSETTDLIEVNMSKIESNTTQLQQQQISINTNTNDIQDIQNKITNFKFWQGEVKTFNNEANRSNFINANQLVLTTDYTLAQTTGATIYYMIIFVRNI